MPINDNQPVPVTKTTTPEPALPKEGTNRKNDKQQTTPKKHARDDV